MMGSYIYSQPPNVTCLPGEHVLSLKPWKPTCGFAVCSLSDLCWLQLHPYPCIKRKHLTCVKH